jgi:uncharacterized protein (DUF433 family)
MNLPEFLSERDGDIVLTGHRIDIRDIVVGYESGYSPEMLVCKYPTLSLALVHKVIAFYLEHKEDVGRYVAQYDQDLERFRNERASRLNVTALRQRLEALQEKETASSPGR